MLGIGSIRVVWCQCSPANDTHFKFTQKRDEVYFFCAPRPNFSLLSSHYHTTLSNHRLAYGQSSPNKQQSGVPLRVTAMSHVQFVPNPDFDILNTPPAAAGPRSRVARLSLIAQA